MSINDLKEKIKSLFPNTSVLYKLDSSTKERLLTSIIIVLIAGAAFGLGRLSVLSNKKTPIAIEYPGNEATTTSATQNETQNQSGEVVASKNGTVYYFPWCGGVKRISEANKVTFASKEEAEQKGYVPAGNCRGL